MPKIIRLPEVIRTTGLARSTIYKGIESGIFPQQIKLGPKSVGWIEQEIMQWLEARISASRPGNT
jgi:prophage regulatory protein